MSEGARHLIIVVEESDSTVGFYDSLDGSLVARIKVGHWPHEIELSPDGRLAYVSNFGLKDYDETIGSPGHSISVIDLDNMCEVERLYTFDGSDTYSAPHSLKLIPGGESLYVNVEKGDRLLVFDSGHSYFSRAFSMPFPSLESSVEIPFEQNFPLPRGAHNLLFSPTGNKLWISLGRAGVISVDPDTGKGIDHISLGATSAARGAAYTPDGKELIVSGTGEVCVVDPNTAQIIARYKVEDAGQFLYPAVTGDNHFLLAPAVWQSEVVVLDTEPPTCPVGVFVDTPRG